MLVLAVIKVEAIAIIMYIPVDIIKDTPDLVEFVSFNDS